MAWWDDIRDMLKQELGSPAAKPVPAAETLAPAPLRQAQLLLQRTARELAEARVRAEAVARRLTRAQAQLEALTRAPQPHPRYRERLQELARTIARDSDLAGSFQSHLAQIDLLHDQVSRQLRELDHDLVMARAASTLGQATRAVAGRGATPRPAAKPAATKTAKSTKSTKSTKPKPAGFKDARSSPVLATLEKLPRRRPGRRDED